MRWLLVFFLASLVFASLASSVVAWGWCVGCGDALGAGGLRVQRLPPGIYEARYTGVGGVGAGVAGGVRLLAFYPDPALWERLASAPLVVGRGGGVVVDRFGIVYSYGVDAVVGDVEPLAAGGGGVEAVVVIPGEELRWFAERLADIHGRLGVATRIVTLEEIVEGYGAAEEPPGTVDPEALEACCGEGYDLDAALRLISYLRSLYLSRVGYVVLVGGSGDIPPIYYYSPTLDYYAGRGQGMVPTDYWYMDPDYNMVPDFAVGRIPFSDRERLEAYLEALERWVDWVQGGGGGEAFLAGGAPFAWAIMLGEVGVADAGKNLAQYMDVEYSTLSMGNYGPTSVLEALGRRPVEVLVMHGAGDRLVDYFPRGVWGYQFVEMLNSDVVESSRGRYSLPGVYLSPACMSAQWDYDTVTPPFRPPSVGVAVVGYGAGVAYIGPSRIALEAVAGAEFSTDGRIGVSYGGAVKLVSLVALWLGGSDTVGEAYRRALTSYLVSTRNLFYLVLPTGGEDVAELTMIEFTLLGDPVAPLPWREPIRGVGDVEAEVSHTLALPMHTVFPGLSSIGEGEVALVAAGPGSSVNITLSPCPGEVVVRAVKRYASDMLVDLVEPEYRVVGGDGNCTVVLWVSVGEPSIHMVAGVYDGVYVRRLFAVAGVSAEAVGDRIVLEAAGLDILRQTGDEPLAVVANGTVLGFVPGGDEGDVASTVAYRVPGGLTGSLVVKLVPWRSYSGIVAGEEAEHDYTRLGEALTARVTVAGGLEVLATSTGGRAYIATLYGGRVVDARVEFDTVYGRAVVEKLSEGVYLVTSLSETSIVRIRAYYGGSSAVETIVLGGAPTASTGFEEGRSGGLLAAFAVAAATTGLVAAASWAGAEKRLGKPSHPG